MEPSVVWASLYLVCEYMCRISLWACLYSVCVCVCLCPAICRPWNMISSSLFHNFQHSSKRGARVPGNLREQREADFRAEENDRSECWLPQKRVGEEGREELKGLRFPAAQPLSTPELEEESCDKLRQSDLCETRQVIYNRPEKSLFQGFSLAHVELMQKSDSKCPL